MRFLKLFLISVFGLAVVVFLLSLLLPPNAVVERTGVIESPKDTVAAHLTDLHRWKSWYPMFQQDTLYEVQLSEPGSGAGAWAHWTSKKDPTDTGRITITSIDDHSVHYHLSARGGQNADGGFEIKSTPEGAGTALHWYVTSHLGYLPWWKFFGFVADRVLGPQMEGALNALRADCEHTVVSKQVQPADSLATP